MNYYLILLIFTMDSGVGDSVFCHLSRFRSIGDSPTPRMEYNNIAGYIPTQSGQ